MAGLTDSYYIGSLIKQFLITPGRYEMMYLKACIILADTASITSRLFP
jgi:hypothetical protein